MDQPTQETAVDDATRASKGFGRFLVAAAVLFKLVTVKSLATMLNFPPADIDRCERDTNPGLVFVESLRDKDIICPTDISVLVDALRHINLHDVAQNVTRIFERNCHQNKSTPTTPPKTDEKSENFIEELKVTYKDLYNRLQPNPYFRDRLQCVDNVFIDSGIEYLNNEGGRNSDGRWEKLDSYQDLFKDSSQQNAKMFLLYGEPGFGKSTLALQYVYDWCNPTPESPLKDIHLLIYLPLRLVKGFASIFMAIKQILLPLEYKLSEQDISDIICSCKSVLIIFDGFDEYSRPDDKSKDDVTSILTRKLLRDKKVFVTTRPPFTPPNLSHDTKKFKLTGFDDKAKESYITKAVANQGIASAGKILQFLQENHVLADICQVPLFFVMFTHMTHRKEMTRVFNSVTRFFCYIVSCFYVHMEIKVDTENATAQRQLQTEQHELHRVAFESLTRKDQTLVWSKEEFTKQIGENLYKELVEIGILIEEDVLRFVDEPGVAPGDHIQKRKDVRFYHKLFCEWYAAHYVTDCVKRAEKSTLKKLTYQAQCAIGLRDSNLHRLFENIDPFHLQYMLRFACGINPAVADRVIRYLRSFEGGDTFAILCIFEQTGQIDKMHESIRQICLEGVIISRYDNLLLQRSSVQLLEIATKNDNPVSYVCLYNCLQSVDLSAAVIRTTSGLALTSKIPVKKLVVALYNRETTKDEYTAILAFSTICPSVRHVWFDGSAPPRSFTKLNSLSTLRSRNVTVKYLGLFQSSPKYILNLMTGRWEREDNGLECTERGFKRMNSDWAWMQGHTDSHYKRVVPVIREFLRKFNVD